MTKLFRKNDRHPEDPRVLIIKDFEDFELWEQRKNLGFEGILLQGFVSKDDCNLISKDFNKVFQELGRWKVVAQNDHDLFDDYLMQQFQKLTLQKIEQCTALFKQLTRAEKAYNEVHLRVNSDSPSFLHTHQATLATLFSGEGTQFVKPNYVFTEEELKNRKSIKTPGPEYTYTVNPGDLIMFENIWHMGGKLSDNPEENPRTQLLMV